MNEFCFFSRKPQVYHFSECIILVSEFLSHWLYHFTVWDRVLELITVIVRKTLPKLLLLTRRCVHSHCNACSKQHYMILYGTVDWWCHAPCVSCRRPRVRIPTSCHKAWPGFESRLIMLSCLLLDSRMLGFVDHCMTCVCVCLLQVAGGDVMPTRRHLCFEFVYFHLIVPRK